MSTSLAERDRGGPAGTHKYLSFTLQGEVYAMGIEQVKEIIEFGPITLVPMMPAFMRGVINLRGMVVPVIDLSRRFGGEPSPVGRRTCVVILELPASEASDIGPQVIGVIVDAVNAVLDIAAAAIEPPPSFGTGIRPDFLQGMGKVKERFVLILNVQKTLSLEELKDLRDAPAHEALT
jgi:purine-binding chemotaxis protein CheW